MTRSIVLLLALLSAAAAVHGNVLQAAQDQCATPDGVCKTHGDSLLQVQHNTVENLVVEEDESLEEDDAESQGDGDEEESHSGGPTDCNVGCNRRRGPGSCEKRRRGGTGCEPSGQRAACETQEPSAGVNAACRDETFEANEGQPNCGEMTCKEGFKCVGYKWEEYAGTLGKCMVGPGSVPGLTSTLLDLGGGTIANTHARWHLLTAADKNDPGTVFLGWHEDGGTTAEGSLTGKVHVTKLSISGATAAVNGDVVFDGFWMNGGMDTTPDGRVGTICGWDYKPWHDQAKQWGKYPVAIMAVCEIDGKTMTKNRTPWRMGQHYGEGRKIGWGNTKDPNKCTGWYSYPLDYGTAKRAFGEGMLIYHPALDDGTWIAATGILNGDHYGYSDFSVPDNAPEEQGSHCGKAPDTGGMNGGATINKNGEYPACTDMPSSIVNREGMRGKEAGLPGKLKCDGGHVSGSGAFHHNPETGEIFVSCWGDGMGPQAYVHQPLEGKKEKIWDIPGGGNKKAGRFSGTGNARGLPNGGWIFLAGGMTPDENKEIRAKAERDGKSEYDTFWAHVEALENIDEPPGNRKGIAQQWASCIVFNKQGEVVHEKVLSTKEENVAAGGLKLASLGASDGKADRFLVGWLHTPVDYMNLAAFSVDPDFKVVEVDSNCEITTGPHRVPWENAWGGFLEWSTTLEGKVVWVTPENNEQGGVTKASVAVYECQTCGSTQVPSATTPPATPEPTLEPTPEATPEPTPEATPEPTPEVTPEPTSEATPESTPDVGATCGAGCPVLGATCACPDSRGCTTWYQNEKVCTDKGCEWCGAETVEAGGTPAPEATEPTWSISSPAINKGGSFTITLQRPSSLRSKTDWIGIYKMGDNTRIAFQFTNDDSSSTVTLSSDGWNPPLDLDAGTYWFLYSSPRDEWSAHKEGSWTGDGSTNTLTVS